MATLTITFKGSDETKASLSSVTGGLNDVGRAADLAGEKGGGFFSGMLEAATGFLAANVVTAISGQFLDAASSVISFASDGQQSINDFQAGLGVTLDEATALGDIGREVFAEGWGDDLGDVTDSLITVRQQMRGLADDELAAVTETALQMRDVFEFDVAESTNAANTLMQNFGLTSQQAFDFIVAGQQRGLNASGDFLDSIGEYSVQFGEAGFTADQFFSAMETGLQGGVLGTDKVLDAVKEGRIRIMEMSDDVVEAFADIGNASFGEQLSEQFGQTGPFFIDTIEKAEAAREALGAMGIDVSVEELLTPLTVVDEATGQLTETAQQFGDVFMSQVLSGIESGSLTVADAQALALEGLRNMDNQVWQNSAGVALFGTQWEDLGATALLSVDLTKTSLEELAGSTDSLGAHYDNFGQVFEVFKRQALVAFEPIGEALLGLANDVMPYVEEGFSWLADELPRMFDGVGEVIEWISSLFGGELAPAVDEAASTFSSVRSTVGAEMEAIGQVVGSVLDQVLAFWNDNGDEILGFVDTTWQQINEIIQLSMELINATVIPALQAVAGYISTHGADIQRVLGAAWNVITTVISSALNVLQGAINTVLAAVRGDWSGAWESLQTMSADFVTGILDIVTSFLDLIASFFGTSLNELVDLWSSNWDKLVELTDTLVGDLIDLITGLPGKVAGVGEAVVTMIWDGIKAQWSKLTDWFDDQLQALRDKLPFSEPKDSSSPLYGLGRAGESIVTMILGGMQARAGVLPGALADIADESLLELLRALDAGMPALESALDGIVEAMRQSVANAGDAAKSEMERQVDAIVEAAGRLPDLIGRATVGMFDLQADMARQELRNLERLESFGDRGGHVQMALDEAKREASEIEDPAEAAAYFAKRSEQIFELANLEREYRDAGAKELDQLNDAHAKKLGDLATERANLDKKYLEASTDEERTRINEQIRANEAARREAEANYQLEGRQINELTEAERARLRQRIDLVKQAQAAELEALKARQEQEQSMFEDLSSTMSNVFSQLPSHLIPPELLANIQALEALLVQLNQSADTGSVYIPAPTPMGDAGFRAAPAPVSQQVFHIDARGSTMSTAEYERIVRKVVDEAAAAADIRLRTR